MNAILVLSTGEYFEGRAFGYKGSAIGEVVFNTSMTGYQEILTDPSYTQQIINFTAPHIGNYGICETDSQSASIQAAGVIVREVSVEPSSFRSEIDLNTWLIENKVVGIEHIATRDLTLKIREQGATMGIILHDADATDVSRALEILAEAPKYGSQNLTEEKSVNASFQVLQEKGLITLGPVAEKRGTRVVVLDFGTKYNIFRSLLGRALDVVVVPGAQATVEQLEELHADGILVSNGPGDPSQMGDFLPELRRICERFKTFGICLGHQLIAAAFDAQLYKLGFGHRGPNQPVKVMKKGGVIITSQNHGYAVSPDDFPEVLKMTQINLNDNSVEAFEHLALPVFGVQYHPEAGPGPHDADFVFDDFKKMLNAS